MTIGNFLKPHRHGSRILIVLVILSFSSSTTTTFKRETEDLWWILGAWWCAAQSFIDRKKRKKRSLPARLDWLLDSSQVCKPSLEIASWSSQSSSQFCLTERCRNLWGNLTVCSSLQGTHYSSKFVLWCAYTIDDINFAGPSNLEKPSFASSLLTSDTLSGVDEAADVLVKIYRVQLWAGWWCKQALMLVFCKYISSRTPSTYIICKILKPNYSC